MVIVHLDGRYFENMPDVMKITIHYDDNIFFHYYVYYHRTCLVLCFVSRANFVPKYIANKNVCIKMQVWKSLEFKKLHYFAA